MADTVQQDGGRSSIFDQLLSSILDGDIKPGDRLLETSLAERFGVSRTPVREAIKRLQSDGFVEPDGRRGLALRKLDHQSVTELYLLRENLEGMAAALCARHASDAEVEALREMVEADEAALGKKSQTNRFVRTNRLFHQALYRGAHNRYLLEALDRLSLHTTLLGSSTLQDKARRRTGIAEHRKIVEAIEKRDSDLARERGTQHIREAHRARLRLMFETDVSE